LQTSLHDSTSLTAQERPVPQGAEGRASSQKPIDHRALSRPPKSSGAAAAGVSHGKD
jgi:hypothetical protein